MRSPPEHRLLRHRRARELAPLNRRGQSGLGRGLKRAVALAAIFLLSACVETGGPAPQRGRLLRIASWNMEHLAARDGEGCRPRFESDYAELRRHAAAIGADVIAFQEVESEAAAQRVFTPDLWHVVIEAREDGRGGGCRGLPGKSLRAQKVGFAIRKGVRFVRHDDVRELGLGRDGLRWGVDVTIAGEQPLRLLSVHLKSGCNSGRSASDADCDLLFAQLPVLERWIEERGREGAAFAVLGDWNRRLAARGDAFWAEIDDGDPAAADLTLAAGSRQASCKARFREFIDHIALGRAAAQRVVAGSVAEFTYGGPEAAHPSDHCPVSVSIS